MNFSCKTVKQIALRDRIHRVVKDAYNLHEIGDNETVNQWVLFQIKTALEQHAPFDDALPLFGEDERNPPDLTDAQIKEIAEKNNSVMELKERSSK